MKLPAPKAVIFDWDNTLVDTWPVIHAALNATLKEMGHAEWTFEQTKARVRKSMRDSFPELFGDKWEKAGEIYQAQYRGMHLQDLETAAAGRRSAGEGEGAWGCSRWSSAIKKGRTCGKK